MKIAININELTLRQNTGVKVYTREIVRALGRVDKENEYILYIKSLSKTELSSEASELSSVLDSDFDRFKKFKIQNSKFNKPFWTYLKLPQEIKKNQPDILFMPIQTVPFFKKPKNMKVVVTVHDLAFLLFPDHFTKKDRFLLNFHTKRAVRIADKIITPSEATKKDIVRFYGINEDKIKVVWHGVEARHCLVSITTATKLANKPYILFVGSIQPRKNITGLIEAFEKIKENSPNPLFQIRNNVKLVICGGRGWMAEEIYKRAKESKFSDDIIFTGSVSDEERDEFYKNALIFALPSFYEGFGLPVLEAMSYGVPCIVGNNSSLSEIVGDNALLVDANSSGDIAEKINLLLSNSELRKDLSRRGIENVEKFSWNKAAEKTLEVFAGCDL